MKLATKLLAPVNTTIISILGLGQMLIGFWLILPFNSWGQVSPTPIPESIIGVVLLIIGIFITIFSLLTNLKALQWATTAGYLFWLISMVVMLAVNYAGTGWIFSLIFAVYCFMISLNIRVNRKFLKK
ncbi:MAG: hypothetical protein HMLIMOIP_002725 [Candidatus Nitrosomirales archaeon]|jgi:hypothetical protein